MGSDALAGPLIDPSQAVTLLESRLAECASGELLEMVEFF